ncbi:MAG: hypothetical protein AB7F67_13480 [Rhodospirillaceae bacterium]
MRAPTDRRVRLIAGGLAVAALAATAAYAVLLGPALRYWDEDIHLGIARNLASAGVFGYRAMGSTAFEPPGYPFFVAAVVAVADHPVAVRLAQVALLGATALLWARIAARVAGPGAGWTAAALVLCYPPLAYGATALYPQTLAGFLIALVCAFAFGAGRGRLAGAGAALGALALTAPPYAVVALPLADYLRRRGARWRALAGAAAVAAVVVGAWTLRNALVFDRFAPVATSGGSALLVGNAPAATAGSGSAVDVTEYELWAPETDEFANERYFTALALGRIAAEPAAAARHYLAKLAHWFLPASPDADGAGRGRTLVLWAGYAVLAGGAILRLAGARRRPLAAEERCLLWAYLAVALAYAVFFTRLRFRLPVDPMLAVLAAAWLSRRWSAGAAPPPPPGRAG